MVFESLVADLLNKYLGQYVKNLDASQLKIGIWGGKNLNILDFDCTFQNNLCAALYSFSNTRIFKVKRPFSKENSYVDAYANT